MVTPRVRRAAQLAISLGLVAALVVAADWRDVFQALWQLDPGWLFVAGLLFIPQTILSAWRWQVLLAPLVQVSLAASLRQTLIANAWNLVIPAKLGDWSKGMLATDVPAQQRQAAGLVFLEKLLDLGSLALFAGLAACGGATLFGQTWGLVIVVTIAACASRSQLGHRAWALPLALLLWSLHFAQLHALLRSAGLNVSWDSTLLRIPPALLAGLFPGSWCGVGPRDTALVWLYRDLAPASIMAAVGLLTSLRYLVPGGVGILLLGQRWTRQSTVAAHQGLSPARS